MGISIAATLGLDSRPELMAPSDSAISTMMLSPVVKPLSSDQRWTKRLAQERADAHLLNTARQDPRVMADIQAALSRAEVQQELVAAPAVKPVLTQKEALKARAESDRLMWNAALSDPRLMEDLQEAMRRAETAALAIQDPVAQEAALAEIRTTAMLYPAVKRVVKRSFLVGIPANLRQTA